MCAIVADCEYIGGTWYPIVRYARVKFQADNGYRCFCQAERDARIAVRTSLRFKQINGGLITSLLRWESGEHDNSVGECRCEKEVWAEDGT